MIAPFQELLRAAQRGHQGVCGFTCYNLETVVAVVEAARRVSGPAILIISDQAFRSVGGDALMLSAVAVARAAEVALAVQLDHCGDLDVIRHAFELGANAVMADGSRLPFEDNVALVSQAVKVARSVDGQVEAELGRVDGDEEFASVAKRGALTDPESVADFLKRSGAHCLAVSIGNTHGTYARKPELDWQRLEAVAARSNVPLSLHGASGLPDADLHSAIARGIAKVNVNTELRHRYLAALSATLPDVMEGAQLLKLNQSVIADLSLVAEVIMRNLTPAAQLSQAD